MQPFSHISPFSLCVSSGKIYACARDRDLFSLSLCLPALELVFCSRQEAVSERRREGKEEERLKTKAHILRNPKEGDRKLRCLTFTGSCPRNTLSFCRDSITCVPCKILCNADRAFCLILSFYSSEIIQIEVCETEKNCELELMINCARNRSLS